MIKLLKLFKQSILEGKQVGTIYHFTHYKAAMNIIKDKYTLKNLTMDADGETSFVSFSRYKDLKSPTISRNLATMDDEDKIVPEFLSAYDNLVKYLKANNIDFTLVDSYTR